MRSGTARGYVLSVMTEEQLDNLHAMERRLGYCLPSGAIHEHFNTDKHGQVGENTFAKVERVVSAIENRTKGQWIAKNPDTFLFDGVKIQHMVDHEIKRQNIAFPTMNQNVSEIRERIRGNKTKSASELMQAYSGE